MPFYTTETKVMLTLPDIGSVSTISSEDIAHFINRIDARINSKLSKRYTVPVSNSPMLELIATDLTVYDLLAKRVYVRNTTKDSPWLKGFKETDELLDSIAQGDSVLLDSTNTVISVKTTGAGSVWSNNSGYTPTFAEDDPDQSFIDDDKLDNIDANRD